MPGKNYQLKIHSIGGDTRLLQCDPAYNPGLCGTVPGGTYLVMDKFNAGPSTQVNGATKECRLPSGDYNDIMFLVTADDSPWQTANTWQNAPGVSAFSIR